MLQIHLFEGQSRVVWGEQGVKSHINLKCAVHASVQDVGSDGQGMDGPSHPFFCQFGG